MPATALTVYSRTVGESSFNENTSSIRRIAIRSILNGPRSSRTEKFAVIQKKDQVQLTSRPNWFRIGRFDVRHFFNKAMLQYLLSLLRGVGRMAVQMPHGIKVMGSIPAHTLTLREPTSQHELRKVKLIKNEPFCYAGHIKRLKMSV